MAVTRLARLAAALGSLALLTSSAANGDAAFDDPVGDQRNTAELVAPDITGIQVSNTRDGLVTFRVTIVNLQTLPAGSRIALLFDLDREQATGDLGFERTVRHDVNAAGQATVSFERWDEAVFGLVEIPSTNLTSSFSNGVYTLTIRRTELENAAGFAFGLYAALLDQDGDDHAVDDAPNANLWTYELAGLPAPRLSTTRLMVMPARPVAGRAFTIGASVRRLDTGRVVTSGAVTCVARVGQERVRASGRFAGGRARCVVSIPVNAKGKMLRGTITIRSAGATVKRAFSYRVA